MPPVAVAEVMLALFWPWQVSGEALAVVMLGTLGAVMVTVKVPEQLLASFAVTVYVPAVKLLAVAVLLTFGDQV